MVENFIGILILAAVTFIIIWLCSNESRLIREQNNKMAAMKKTESEMLKTWTEIKNKTITKKVVVTLNDGKERIVDLVIEGEFIYAHGIKTGVIPATDKIIERFGQMKRQVKTHGLSKNSVYYTPYAIMSITLKP